MPEADRAREQERAEALARQLIAGWGGVTGLRLKVEAAKCAVTALKATQTFRLPLRLWLPDTREIRRLLLYLEAVAKSLPPLPPIPEPDSDPAAGSDGAENEERPEGDGGEGAAGGGA